MSPTDMTVFLTWRQHWWRLLQ